MAFTVINNSFKKCFRFSFQCPRPTRRECVTKFSISIFFHDSKPSRPLIKRQISGENSITKFENFDFAVCMTLRSQNFRFSKPTFILQIFSFMIDVFTPKRISPYCPFNSNKSLTKILILTLRSDAHPGAWLGGGIHTAKPNSAVGCKPRSFLSNFKHLTPRWWAHCRAWLSGGLQTAELDSVVWCTPVSWTPRWDAHAHCGAF